MAALALVFVCCLLIPASAFAAASYVFEPTLSLTGDCSVSPLDEVPDPGCPEPGSSAFNKPSVTTDAYGDIYVASISGEEGHIEVFSPAGKWLTTFSDKNGPRSIAVDSEGNLYVYDLLIGEGKRKIQRFPPSVYKPLAGEIKYGNEPVLLMDDKTKVVLHLSPWVTVAVDSEDHLYVNDSENISEFGSAKEENKILEKEFLKVPEGKSKALEKSAALAIDSVHRKLYVSDITGAGSIVRVFELDPPHKEVGLIDGSTTPKGEFLSGEAFLQLDVEDQSGHVFVGDIFAAKKVYEFEEDGTYLATIEHSFNGISASEIAVDDGEFSPHPQQEGWLFVPSNPSGIGHVYAFEPSEECAAEVLSTSVSDITETEATLHATVNPCGLETTYRLEYVSQQQFEANGFAEATIAGENTLPKGGEGIAVAAAATELEPGTEYRFRASAENTQGEAVKEKTFQTFPAEEEGEPCENEVFRTGFSALLPDCRAYELVTPADTNGRPPSGGFAGVYFPTLRAAPNGNSASFVIEGGLIPGSKGTGAFNGDNYLATRGEKGWTSALAGPLGEEAGALKKPSPGGVSPDQAYSFWEDIDGKFIRYPDGHSELIGRGSEGEDPHVKADLITEGASHIVFTTEAGSAIPLEANAPPAKTAAVYDRSAAGPTHVVSLLPGDITPAAKEDASYLGASEDGEGITFEIAGTIYLRLHDEETFEVAGPSAEFAGVAAGGTRVFYLEGGNLLAFDAEEEKAIPFSGSGDVTVVNVASGGARAYFVSPSVLTTEPNPNGEVAKEGAQNLYLSEAGAFSFVARVTERDVEGEKATNGISGGLGLWLEGLKQFAPAKDPSRATPPGTTLLFESRADLTEFESEGFAQVYRYDSGEDRLACLSCTPTGTPPSGDASLQSVSKEQFSPEPGGGFLRIANQSSDGGRAFFQTAERLVIGDSDRKLDVYEWEEEGIGSCETEGGCTYLISDGQSSGPDYLYAMSQSGNDVFFRTSDQLLARDTEATLSIYDARVGGGFAEPPCEGKGCCEGCCGDECRPLNTAPGLPGPATSTIGPSDNVEAPKHCPKGKHLALRHGKKVCVKNHPKKKHHRRGNGTKRGGAR